VATFLKWLQANWFWFIIGVLVVLCGWGIWSTLSLGGKLATAESIAARISIDLGRANSQLASIRYDIDSLRNINRDIGQDAANLRNENKQLNEFAIAQRAKLKEALSILDGSK
jgi:hypothetical protein